ncbi:MULTISPECIES: DUF3858 domain-containing protein [Chitinophagaceae]
MRFLLTTLLLAATISANADNKRPIIKYGKVDASEFAPTVYSLDSSADAIYLYDKGNAYYEGNTQSFFSIVQERFCRIRLLHKKAFSDVATIEIPLYTPQKESVSMYDKLETLEAATYNLENGKVEVVKVDKPNIFKEQSGNWTTMKFTFPNIKEGSIVEFHYKKSSPRFWDMDDWFFQGQYPRLRSEFQILMPEIFDFTLSPQGYHKIDYDTAIVTKCHYNIMTQNGTGASNHLSVDANATDRTWGMLDVPSLKSENYISSLQNYISRFNFQLSTLRLPDQPVKNYRRSWKEEAEELMKDEDFGKDLGSSNSFLNDDLKSLENADNIAKARNIYYYVRDNYSCSKTRGRYMTQSLKQTWKTKKGSVTDLNLLLVAALRNRGLPADPVLIGTRETLRPSEAYPFMDRFNYVLCKVYVSKDKYYLLDAADKHLGFNHLNEECYNGSGRTINTDFPGLVTLSPDSISDPNTTVVNIINKQDGNGLSGSFQSNLGYFSSQSLRQQVTNSSQKEYFDKIQKGYSFPVTISNTGIDSLNIYDNPVAIHYDFSFDTDKEEVIYFNPILAVLKKDNPFKASERQFPVEMPYRTQETYILIMEVPKGYVVDDMPKSTKVSLNESDGMFQYLISKQDGMIQLIYKVDLQRATFDPEDYEALRNFFAYVVKKQNEPIVFKKVKN